MDIKQKIGQLIVTGFPGTTMSDEFIQLVKAYKVGNVILFSHNVESISQLKGLCDDIQALVQEQTGHPAFITMDQEGGVVARLPKEAANIPSALAVSATQNPANAYAAGKLTADELLACGVNFNFAPDVDVNSNPNNPVIGVRSYGDTPDTVIEYSTQMIKGLQSGGVIAAVKHFPGHGDTAVDSHVGLPVVDKALAELEKLELAPFRAAIAAGVDAVMTTHILFPQLTQERLPATMSKEIITDLLKDKLGFKGLVVTDCLEMQAIQTFYGTPNGALAAIKAGADLLCISHTAEFVVKAYELIGNALTSGELSIERIDDAYEKVLQRKASLKPSALDISTVGSEAHQAIADRISRESITLVAGKLFDMGQQPLFIGSYAYRSTLASSQANNSLNFASYMKDRFGGSAFIPSINPTDEEIERAKAMLAESSSVVIATYNGHISTQQLVLANAMCKAANALGKPSLCIALRNPYDLGMIKGSTALVAAYEYTERAFASLAAVLSVEVAPHGKLRVDISRAEG